MKPRRLRRFVLIVGTLLSVLIAVAFVVSAWWDLEIGIRGGPVIIIFAGSLDVWWAGDVSWFINYNKQEWFPGMQHWNFWSYRRSRVHIPLYPLFLAVAVPTLLVWRIGRKRVQPGHCRCGYDLTGNVSGKCPECGEGT